jgi:hypothetical protein
MGEEKKKLEQVQKFNDQLETLTKEKSVSIANGRREKEIRASPKI